MYFMDHQTEKYIAITHNRHTDHAGNLTISNIAERERQTGKTTVVLHNNQYNLKWQVNCILMNVLTKHMATDFSRSSLRRSLQMFFVSSLSYLHYLWVYLGIRDVTSVCG